MSISIDPTPILSTSILTLFDERSLPGQTLPGGIPSLYSTYTIPAAVGGISVIPLRELPRQLSSVVPTGVTVVQVGGSSYTEVLSSPAANQFYVNYVNGTVQFNPANVGSIITISYTGLGSLVRAETINNITSLLVPIYNTVTGITSDNINFTFTNVTVTGSLAFTTLIEQSVSADPVSPSIGQVWFNTTDNQFKGYNGSSVVLLG